VQWGMGY